MKSCHNVVSLCCQTVRKLEGTFINCISNRLVLMPTSFSLSPVYTIQHVVKPVVQPIWQPVVSCKRGISNRVCDIWNVLPSNIVSWVVFFSHVQTFAGQYGLLGICYVMLNCVLYLLLFCFVWGACVNGGEPCMSCKLLFIKYWLIDWQYASFCTIVTYSYCTYTECSDVAVIFGHSITYVLSGNTAYCVKLSGEDLPRYLNKIESAGLRKCPYGVLSLS